MNSREFQDKLSRRARRAAVTLTPELTERFEVYYRLLSNWNTRINLTGLNLADVSPEALARLLIEPLVAAKHVPLSAVRMLDVGSGGGSPAIPLALAVPRLQPVLVESKTRKSVFLRETIRALDLKSAAVVTARFEELLSRPDLHEAQDLVTLRAVRLETRTLMTLQAFIKPGGLAFLFRSSTTPDPTGIPTPPLFWRATYPLIESLRSRLVVLEKRAVAPSVPRATI